MICNYCGFECLDTAVFCPHCGKKLEKAVNDIPFEKEDNFSNQESSYYESSQYIPSFRDKVGAMLKSGLFLALCILVSASAVLGLGLGRLPILNVLATVFLWCIFSKAKKNQLDVKNLYHLSGVVYAQYVINWVITGILGLVGVLCLVFSDYFHINGNLSKIFDELKEEIPEIEESLNSLGNNFQADFIIKLCAFLVLAVAVFMALLNIFGIGRIHKFAKSFYQSATVNENRLQGVNSASTWMLVFGIFSGIGALSSVEDISSFLFVGSSAAVYIIAYILVKKYFQM